jgi:MPBQ/MSBQ methyltransferase
MAHMRNAVERHYGCGELLNSILRALNDIGKDIAKLAPSDFAPVGEFHIRGHEATIELAKRTSLRPGLRVLDVGRDLEVPHAFWPLSINARSLGLISHRNTLTLRILWRIFGLNDRVKFYQNSVLEMPFYDSAFNVVWSKHAQMNIAARFTLADGKYCERQVREDDPHFSRGTNRCCSSSRKERLTPHAYTAKPAGLAHAL